MLLKFSDLHGAECFHFPLAFSMVKQRSSTSTLLVKLTSMFWFNAAKRCQENGLLTDLQNITALYHKKRSKTRHFYMQIHLKVCDLFFFIPKCCWHIIRKVIWYVTKLQIFKILCNISLFSSSCLCPVLAVSVLHYEKRVAWKFENS